MVQPLSPIVDAAKKVIKPLWNDTNLFCAVDITYKVWTGQTFVSGRTESTFDEHEIKALRLRHGVKSLFVGQGEIEAGDQVYMILYADAPDGMSKKDEIIDENGDVQKPKSFNHIYDLAVAVTIEGG